MSICSNQSFTLFYIQTSSSSMHVPTSSFAHALSVYLLPLTLWNSLPHSVRFCESLTTFRKHLKTFYFKSAFPGTTINPLPQRLRFIIWYWRFINSFTYLLTYLLTWWSWISDMMSHFQHGGHHVCQPFTAASAGCPLARQARVTLLARYMSYSSWSIVHSYLLFKLDNFAWSYVRKHRGP